MEKCGMLTILTMMVKYSGPLVDPKLWLGQSRSKQVDSSLSKSKALIRT